MTEVPLYAFGGMGSLCAEKPKPWALSPRPKPETRAGARSRRLAARARNEKTKAPELFFWSRTRLVPRRAKRPGSVRIKRGIDSLWTVQEPGLAGPAARQEQSLPVGGRLCSPCTVHACWGSISRIKAPSSWRFRSKRFLFLETS